MANPVSSAPDLDFTIEIAGEAMDLVSFAVQDAGCPADHCPGGYIPPGMAVAPIFGGLMDGPVEVVSMSGGEGIVSQRILWNGDSLEEVPAISGDDLSNHYIWPWYDNQSPGVTDWLLVSNPGEAPVDYAISIAGEEAGAGTLLPGERVTPTFPGRMGGPLEVTATGTVIASQRVLSFGGTAFNELPGIPEQGLSNRYLWTWYDYQSPGAADWVMLANPDDTPVFAEIRIAGESVWAESIEPGEVVTPTFPGTMGGLVEAEAWTGADRAEPARLLATRRSLWGASFDEVPGFPRSKLAARYHWTWYDQLTPGVLSWVLMANPGETPAVCEVKVGGVVYWSGTLAPGENAAPTLPWVMGGPVEVTSNGAAVMATQRVLWQGHFGETPGMVLKDQVPVEPEWELRQLVRNPHPGSFVDEFLVRGTAGAGLFASSNAALWPDPAPGFDYRWAGGSRQPDLNPVPDKAQFGMVHSPADGSQGRIYMAGQAWFADTPQASTRRRSLVTVWDLAGDSFQNVEMNAPGKKTDNRNELVSLMDDGGRLIAGEAGAPPDPRGDSDFPWGSGLWLIPKDTITDPATWSRIFQIPIPGSGINWHDLIKRGDTYYALQTAGTWHSLISSQDLVIWSGVWTEDTQERQEARSNLLLDASGNLLVVHERAGSDRLWVSVFDGDTWAHHQTGILTAVPGGSETSLDIAAAFDGQGRLIVVRGRGALWNGTPGFSDVFIINPQDWSHRIRFAGVPGWPMHQKRLPQSGGDTYFSTSYPGYLYVLSGNL